MHARMTVPHARPDRFDGAVTAVQETFVPAAQAQSGYGSFLLLTDRKQHQLIGIGLWETEADLQASGATGGYYAERMVQFVDIADPACVATS